MLFLRFCWHKYIHSAFTNVKGPRSSSSIWRGCSSHLCEVVNHCSNEWLQILYIQHLKGICSIAVTEGFNPWEGHKTVQCFVAQTLKRNLFFWICEFHSLISTPDPPPSSHEIYNHLDCNQGKLLGPKLPWAILLSCHWYNTNIHYCSSSGTRIKNLFSATLFFLFLSTSAAARYILSFFLCNVYLINRTPPPFYTPHL